MKYIKTIIFEFIVLLSLLLINTCLYYFNIISDNTNNIFEIFIFIITFILTGIYISRRCNNKTAARRHQEFKVVFCGIF